MKKILVSIELRAVSITFRNVYVNVTKGELTKKSEENVQKLRS